jgi:hypothetical protein
MVYVLLNDRGPHATPLPGKFFTQAAAYKEACRYAEQLGQPIYIYSEDTQTRYTTVYPGNTPEDFTPWRS